MGHSCETPYVGAAASFPPVPGGGFFLREDLRAGTSLS